MKKVFALVLALMQVLSRSSAGNSDIASGFSSSSDITASGFSSSSDITASGFGSGDLVAEDTKTCDTLYLLNVMPYPDNDTFAGWDRGFELIPAGQLAIRHINDNPTILLEHKVELLTVKSEACGRSLVINTFKNYSIQSLGQTRSCVFGVVGLFCSIVTNMMAPIANHPNFGYVQLAASTSPIHRDPIKFPYTFHTISSAAILNTAMIALMDAFNWSRVHLVFDNLGLFFISTAEDFARQMMQETEKTLISKIGVQPNHDSISRAFNQIEDSAARIGFLTLSVDEVASFFCEAYKRRFLWPGYVFVLHEQIEQVTQVHNLDCTLEEINRAQEGIYILRYGLSAAPETTLVSGQTYEEYHDQYLEELQNFSQESGMNLNSNVYANSLYDQVWAFALAANLSLDAIDFIETSSSLNTVEHELYVRGILAQKLKQVKFEGASGPVRFGRANEVQTTVKIYQIRNGTSMLIGEYDANEENITFVGGFDQSDIPEDSFEMRNQLVQRWVGVVFILADTVLLCLVIFNMILIVYWRKKPEIKSGSVPLSLLILLGCCLLCVSPILKTVTTMFVISTPALFTALCNVFLWSFLCGNFLIFVTLFFRLLRIFHIFRSYQVTGKYWSDKFMFLYIALTFAVMIILLILWTIIDTVSHIQERRYIPTGRPPYFLLHSYCTSNSFGVWLAVYFSLIGVFMLLLVFLAVQTRHIKRRHFKDTKKVNMFIYSVCIIYTILLPLWMILSAVNFDTGSYVCQMLAIEVVTALCLVFLFLPKTFPLLCKKRVASLPDFSSIIVNRHAF